MPAHPMQTLSQRWAGLPAWRILSEAPPADLEGWAREHLRLLVRWEASAPALLAGESLAHTDLNARNLLIGDGVHVIDWAWPCQTGAWVDVAFLVLRLIDAGHTAEEAEAWAAALPAWREASDRALTAFAVAVAGLWEHRSRTDPAPHRPRLSAVARGWARHRLGSAGA